MLSQSFIKLLPAVFLSAGLIISQTNQAALTVSPTRAVFDQKTRSMPIKLINADTKTVTYRISFQNMRMTEAGAYEEIDAAKVQGRYAERMVRYAPRQVTLQAGQTQSIRLLLRKPKRLADGEYRSHLLFEEVPDTAGLDLSKVVNEKNEDGIGVILTPISGVTIPVIVRQGKLTAQASIENPVFQPATKETPANVKLTLNRSGNRSMYGDLQIIHYPPNQQEGVIVSVMQGISILSPTAKRHVSMPLEVPPEHPLQGGRLHVVYENTNANGKKTLLSQADLSLP